MGNLHGSHSNGGPNRREGETGPNVSGCLNAPFDDHRKAEWLAVIQECGKRAIACTKIGVSRSTVEKHLKKDEDFKTAYEDAMLVFRESLVAEAVRRGVRGVSEPIYNRGHRVLDIHPEDQDPERLAELEAAGEKPRMIPAVIQRYSDSLLHALLKAHHPEFADKQIVQNIDAGSSTLADLDDLTSEELEQLQAFLQSVKDRKAKEADDGGGAEADVS